MYTKIFVVFGFCCNSLNTLTYPIVSIVCSFYRQKPSETHSLNSLPNRHPSTSKELFVLSPARLCLLHKILEPLRIPTHLTLIYLLGHGDGTVTGITRIPET